MRIPELPLTPGPFENRWEHDSDLPEDEDRIHELVKRANEKTDCHGLRPRNDRSKPQFVGPSA